MKKIAVLYPGQGSHTVGMGHDFYRNFPEAKEVYDLVDYSLKEKLSHIIFSGNVQNLTVTSNAQPAIMATSLAITNVLRKITNKSLSEICSFTAGHSLGEYSALCAGDAISISNTAELLRFRGQVMINAAKNICGSMYALLGANEEKATQLCKILSQSGVCEIANDNGAGQIILSGESKAFTTINNSLKICLIKKAIKIPVSTPFHCSLMGDATTQMSRKLEEYSFNMPTVKTVANFNALFYKDKDSIASLLIKQIEGKVRWRESIEKLYNQHECRTFVEIGPGSVLTNLLKRQYTDIKIYNIQRIADLESFIKKEL
jgi:malonyl CoA-acyl carrier protein transacylase